MSKNFSMELTSIVRNSCLGSLSARDMQVAEHVYQNAVAHTAGDFIRKIDGCKSHDEVNQVINKFKNEFTRFYGLAIFDKITYGGSDE